MDKNYISLLSVFATVMAVATVALPIHAQSINKTSSSDLDDKAVLYVRAAKPQEVFGVWYKLEVPGLTDRGYQAIMADGRCAYLSLKPGVAEQPTILSSSDVIKTLDSQGVNGSPNSWHSCSVTDGDITEAGYGTALAQYCMVEIITDIAEGARPYFSPHPGRQGKPGDLFLRQYYRPDPPLPPWVHLMEPAPLVMRRLSD